LCALNRDQPPCCSVHKTLFTQSTAVDVYAADDAESQATGRQQDSGVLYCHQRAEHVEQSQEY